MFWLICRVLLEPFKEVKSCLIRILGWSFGVLKTKRVQKSMRNEQIGRIEWKDEDDIWSELLLHSFWVQVSKQM